LNQNHPPESLVEKISGKEMPMRAVNQSTNENERAK
jgi:hypothetical protein